MLRDLKYLLAYSIPLVTFFAVQFGGFWSYMTVVESFVLIPILEAVLPIDRGNVKEDEEPDFLSRKVFDYLLYAMVPVQYFVLGFFLWRISFTPLETYELIGMTLSMGIQSGAIGINVAHELGHRNSAFERFLAKALLLSSLYMHFIIEHNRGHHKNVSTPKDPATARFGESLYAFWFRSIVGSFLSAWKIERAQLAKQNRSVWSIHNEMLRFIGIQLALAASIYLGFGVTGLLGFLGSALVGILMLETVNYIEHYGLMRKETAPGRYERVQPWHSWNSDYALGRIILFELTRHSDHHYKASRKYQILRTLPDSPELPTGYPGSMLMSLVPPLWFRMVNPLVKKVRSANP